MNKSILFGAVGILLSGTAVAQGDDCSTATAISTNGTFAYDNTANTTTAFDGGGGCGFGSNTINQDVFWQWTAPAAGDYQFDTNGTTYDTKMSVHSGVGCAATCTDYDDDGGIGTQSLINLSGVNAGDTFLIQVGGFGSNFGPGVLNIGLYVDPCTVATDDTFEDNDTCATAVPITPGSYIDLFASTTDRDFYTIDVPAGDILDVDLVSFTFDVDFDVYIDAGSGACAATPVFEFDDFEVDNTAGTGPLTVIFDAISDPTNSQNCTEYDINVALVTPLDCGTLADDAFEDNDDCATATPVSDGTYTGLSVFKTDKDHYSFCVADGATVACDILFSTSVADLDFFLRDAAAVECGTGNGANELADGFSTTDNETLSWTNTTGADLDVVLEVNVWDSTSNADCNTYDLVISGANTCGGTGTTFCDPNTPNSSGASTTLSGTLGTGVESGLRLNVTNGVPSEFGYFLVSAGFADPGTTISNGQFCLLDGVNPFARYNFGTTTNSIGAFDAAGDFQNLVGTGTSNGGYGYDVATTNPLGGTIMSGESWNFQLWHRDTPAGAGTSTFSNGLTITFP